MTRKSFAKLERAHRAAIERLHATDVARKFHGLPSKLLADSLQPRLVWKDPNDFDSDDQESSDKPATKKASMPAPCAIAAAAFREATPGAVRRQLKNKAALALVVLVPGPSWIEPVKSQFVTRFGEHWYALETDIPKSAQQKAERNRAVADYLARGYPVVGFAVERDALPTALTTAADLTIRMNTPAGSTIRCAIRMFTGKPAPAEIDEKVWFGL
jgi:hypothetical protein